MKRSSNSNNKSSKQSSNQRNKEQITKKKDIYNYSLMQLEKFDKII